MNRFPNRFMHKFLSLSRMGTEIVATVYEKRHSAPLGRESSLELATRRLLARLLGIIANVIRYNPALSTRLSHPISAELTRIANDLTFDY